ncbi:MAG: transglutaminase-like domain-containing protein [candidate division WOR-3 bacterium]
MRKIRIFLPIILIIIGSGIILFQRNHLEKRESQSSNLFENDPKTEYFGIYLKGYKVGYLASRVDSTKDGYRVYSTTYMKLSPIGGMEKEVTYKIVANADFSYNLKDFEFSMFSDNYLFEAIGKRERNNLIVEFTSGGVKRKIIYEIKSSYLPATIEGLVKTGKIGNFKFFDPTLPSSDSLFDISVSVTGKDTIDGIPVIKYVVKQSGIDVLFWVTEKGELLRSESPIGLLMKREKGLIKKDIKPVGFKLYDSYAIRVEKEIKNPREISFLKVRLDSVPLSGLRIEDDRQTLNGNILTIKKIQPGSSSLIPEEVKEFLKPSPFIPSDDERIKTIAKEVVGDKRGLEAVERIISYVDKKLEDKPTFSIPDPIEALNSGEGDCNEHAALAVALLQASGIPARVEVGLVYINGAFYYHAWVGAYLGGKWVSSDPVFGQVIADPTHIKLEYGGFESQAKLYRVINKLQITVLDYD